jgi:hypothetical protein
MKIRLMRVGLFHADRRTDMTKLIVAFCNIANAPKKKRNQYQAMSSCSILFGINVTRTNTPSLQYGTSGSPFATANWLRIMSLKNNKRVRRGLPSKHYHANSLPNITLKSNFMPIITFYNPKSKYSCTASYT